MHFTKRSKLSGYRQIEDIKYLYPFDSENANDREMIRKFWKT